MKKKFVLTLALVLLVVVGLSAATPLTVSGSFKAGYKLTFATNNAIAGVNNGFEGDMDAVVDITGDFWKVSLSGTPVFDAKMAASAEIYLDKALAAQGTDMGDLTLKIAIGNKSDLGGLSAYTNSRDKLTGLKMASGFVGAYAASMTVGYGDLVTVMVGADPVSFLDQQVDVSASIVAKDKNNAIILSAKSTPVEGVTAAVAYTNVDALSAKGSVAGSVAVDVAALAGIEDFGLTASAYDVFLFTGEVNKLYLELKGSYDKISAWTEYRILNKTNDMKLSASYSGIENVGLSAFVELADITKEVATKVETIIGGGVTYTMGGVKYALDVDYATKTEAFTMSPTVKIAF